MKTKYTYEELLKEKTQYIREDKDNYYVKVDYGQRYDDSLWVVDKKTHNVSFMSCNRFVFDGIADSTREIRSLPASK